MTFTETALLGALAGFTIFLGLPLGRVGRIGNRGHVALAFLAVGVLAFARGSEAAAQWPASVRRTAGQTSSPLGFSLGYWTIHWAERSPT